MPKVTLNLPTTTTVAMGKDTGDRLLIDWSRVPANVIEMLVTAGSKVVMANAYNGGGKEAKQADKVAAATKKLDAWYRGEFNVVSRGETGLSALREAYVDDVRAKTGATVKAVEDSIRATVANVFGEKESATFGRFIDAIGTLIARQKHGAKPTEAQVAAEREAFEAKYQALADEASKRRAEATAKLDLTNLVLADFAKSATE